MILPACCPVELLYLLGIDIVDVIVILMLTIIVLSPKKMLPTKSGDFFNTTI